MAASWDHGRGPHRPLSKDVLRALLAESQSTLRHDASAERVPSKVRNSKVPLPCTTPLECRGGASRKRAAAGDATAVSDRAADAALSPVAKKLKENPPASERLNGRRKREKRVKATGGDTSRASIVVTAAAPNVGTTTMAKENGSLHVESSKTRKKKRRSAKVVSTPLRSAEARGDRAATTTASAGDGYAIAALQKTAKNKDGVGASSISGEDVVALKKTKKENKRDIGALRERLDAGRFRYLNELLYTVPSRTAMELFRNDPDSFLVYHRGYKSQTAKWPTSPLDRAIAYVRQRPRSHVVADIGCGDATLAASVPNRVHSFDLVAVNDRVTVADAARLPLGDGCVDIVVFCLSLMGTNFVDFLLEANRILKSSGRMKVLEVTSRFEGRLRPFVRLVERLGFASVAADTSNSHFVDLEFRKVRACSRSAATAAAAASGQPLEFRLQPCLYKKR